MREAEERKMSRSPRELVARRVTNARRASGASGALVSLRVPRCAANGKRCEMRREKVNGDVRRAQESVLEVPWPGMGVQRGGQGELEPVQACGGCKYVRMMHARLQRA